MTTIQPPPTPLEAAIFKTLLYADVFDFPLTQAEVHHYLIEDNATLDAVQTTLADSPWLRARVIHTEGYCAVRRGAARARRSRAAGCATQWEKGVRYGRLLAGLPFVRMVALTGALAVHNARDAHDDLDYLIVTAPGRVWVTRMLAVVAVRLARVWGVELCPNYVLSQTQLAQAQQDLYIAHELAQMVPISGGALYHDMRRANPWADALMPNAGVPLQAPADFTPRGWARRLQGVAEWLLGGWLGDRLESWEQRRKARRFAQEDARYDHSAAIINAEQVKGHFDDYGHGVLCAYEDRLREHGLA
ncbi:MAG: hypothetical protein ACLFTK_16860 [Anaerolineales bacterium]